jgi:hypothetical protein
MRLTESAGNDASVIRGEMHMRRFSKRIGIGTVVFAIGMGAGAPALAGACTTGSQHPSGHKSDIHTAIAIKSSRWGGGHHHGTPVTTSTPSVATQQATLESELSARQAELTLLTGEVSASTSLTAAHKSALQVDIAASSAAIATLVSTVPTDATTAELQADAATLKTDDNGLVVVSDQVTDTIRADRIAARVAAIAAIEPTLQAGVTALVGTPNGARLAFLDANLVSLVTAAQDTSSGVAGSVLAQTGAGYPGNASVFRQASASLNRAANDLTRAEIDRTSIERGLIGGVVI